MTTSRPDDIRSSSAVSEDNNYSRINPDDEDEEDPIIRNIDVFVSPELSRTLHLLQFPIQPANSPSKVVTTTPIEAKLRPKHNMLELEYSIPNMALGGGHHHAHHQQGDSIHHIKQRTFTSNAIAPVTHMALAKLDKTGDRLDVIPLQTNVLQMRPSFKHLHNHDDEENNNDASAAQTNSVDKDTTTTNNNNSSNRQKPIMFQKKESERGAIARRNSYANKRASEESEEWIELDIHSTSVRKDMLRKVSCTTNHHHHHRGNRIRLAKTVTDGGYVRSLNYMESISSAFADADMMMQSATTSTANNNDTAGDTINETAVAELASKLAVLLQEGNGTMIPYRVLRSNFHPSKVSDEMLIMALSSCAVLVRGNFALQSNLTQFLKNNDVMKEMRDLMLLLLNMHGSISRERLIRAYESKASTKDEYKVIDADMITFVLETIAKLSNGYWVSKVEDDVVFAARFPQLASYHAAYWMKKKEMLRDLVELYEQ